MLHTYRIEYVHDDGEGEHTERAYTADDALVQFKVYAAEHLQCGLATKIEPVENAYPMLVRPERAKQGLTFGGALHWLRMGAKLRRPCWGATVQIHLRGDEIVLPPAVDGGTDHWHASSANLLATDWEVVS